MRKLLLPTALLLVALALGLAGEGVERRLGATASAAAAGSVTASPPSALWSGDVAIALRPSEPSHAVVYTTDGSVPSAALGSLYTQPLRLEADVPAMHVIRAVEVRSQGAGSALLGPVVSASYGVGLAPSLPVISLIAEPADLWGEETGLFANPSFRGADWERTVHVTGFLTSTAAFDLPVGLRVDGRERYDAPKQSLRLYFRAERGAARLETALFPDHPHQATDGQSYKRLLLQAGDHGVTWSLLADQVVTVLVRDLGLPAVQGRFVWLFVNGTSWGLYRLTERVDRFMLAENLDITAADVVQEGDARDGSDVEWEALVDVAASSDFAEPDTYASFVAQLDVANFIDFAVLKAVFGFPGDALVAVRPQGGRWFFVFEGGAPFEGSGQDFDVLYRALMANAAFRRAFVARLADLRNTVLAPASIESTLAIASAGVAESYAYERGRWSGVPTWEDEVAALGVSVRDRGDQLAATLGVDVPVRLSEVPTTTGRLYVNGQPVWAGADDWVGWYAPGTRLDVIAVPAPGYAVAGWSGEGEAEVAAGSRAVFTVTEPITLTALFTPVSGDAPGPRPDDVIINELWINDDGTRYSSLRHLPLEGDWVELLVRARGGADLRGWRLTDNDTRDGDAEGTLIFPESEAFADVPCGTVILIVATETPGNAAAFPRDDLDAREGTLVLYVGNGTLDTWSEPGFALGTGNDSLALLSADGTGIDFVAEGREVTPWTFGVLADGVTFDTSFSRLGADDGAAFTGTGSNDTLDGWIVDPPACASQDARCYGVRTVVTPGALNPGQAGYRLRCALQQMRRP